MDDLTAFHQKRIPEVIAEELKEDEAFKTIISDIIRLNQRQKEELIKKVAEEYQPTWAENGRIDKDGQTDAGQIAQREIAEAIARLIRENIGY